MPVNEPATLSAVDLLALYRRRQLSPVEATKAVLQRIDAMDAEVHAFRVVLHEQALAMARESEARWKKGEPLGPLDGVPVTIKDLFPTRGVSTLRGSTTVDPDQPWTDDAPSVARMREAGAVFIGKTTTPEFGWKAVTDSKLTGITRNPWNTARTAGGSSGGMAVAAALGFGALHIGSDAGGSVRIPAAFCGVFGMKPSFGRIPVWPDSPFGTMSHQGPATRTVADAALMLNVITQPDSRDWGALPFDGRDYRIGLEDGVRGLRIAFSPTLGYADIDMEVEQRVQDAARVFEELGAIVEVVDPGFASPLETELTLWRVACHAMLSKLPPGTAEHIDPGLAAMAAEGSRVPLDDYLAANEARIRLGQRMKRFHDDYDLLMTPALPIPAFAAGQTLADPERQTTWFDWTPFSYPFNMTQQPAAVVPCGFSHDDLPLAFQIVGPMHGDALVLRAARAYEGLHPFEMPAAPQHGN